MNVFETEDYRQIIKARLAQKPKGGYGQLSKLADAIGVSSTFISQVYAGTKEFSLEQAVLAAEYIGLNNREKEYFILIVQKARAGHPALTSLLDQQIQRFKQVSKEVASHMPEFKTLDEATKATFYSDWIYSAIRQVSALPAHNSIDAISSRLQQPAHLIAEALLFLVESGLCIEKDGEYFLGPSRTHLGPDSPWIKSHHTNWRLRAIDKIHDRNNNKLHYSSPMTLSLKDIPKGRQILLDAIRDLNAIVDKTTSEEFYCVNVDWFRP